MIWFRVYRNSISIAMEKKRKKHECCFENDVSFKIGEWWTDHDSCELKKCEPGGRISVQLCPPLDLSSGCSRVEGDLNQEFPQCCPVLECSRNEPSSESSSSSSSSDEDEEDLFDDDGDLDVFSFDDPSNQTVDKLREDNSSQTKTDLEAKHNKVFSNSQIRMKNDDFEDNKPHKIVIQFTKSTITSNENISADNKESAKSLTSNEAVLQDITNRGEPIINEPSSHLERQTEPQEQSDFSEDKYIKETKVTSETLSTDKDAAGTTADKVVETQWIGVNKAMDSITENKTVVESINTVRENLTTELAGLENADSAHMSQSSCEVSMDSINFSARDLDEKKSMASHLKTAQYKITDYLDDIQDDPKFKDLNDSEKTTHEALQNNHELSSISLETRQNVHDFQNIANKTLFEDDEKYIEYHAEDSTFLSGKSSETTGKEEMDEHNFDNNEEVLYKTETADGVIYNPVDSEGFLINPEDNILIHNASNATISESTIDQTPNPFEENSQPGLQDKISYDLEILDHKANENYDEGSSRIIGSEEMLNTNETIDIIQNNDNSEEYTNANIQPVDHLYTETENLIDINVEEPLQTHASIDSTIINEDNEDNEEFVTNNENTGSLDGVLNDQVLEENQITDFTGNHHAIDDDNVSVNSFDMKVENQLPDNEEDFENIDGADHEIIDQEDQEDTPGYMDEETQVQGFEEPIQTYQNHEEEEEEDYNSAKGFEEINSSELAEEESNYTTTEQSSHLEGSSESTTDVTDAFEDTTDDID